MKLKKPYKLAIVPKVPWYDQYSYAYGSQHDYLHTRQCLKKITNEINLDFSITYTNTFLKNFKKYDGVLFIGLNKNAMNFLKTNQTIDKFTWSFNQIEWVNNRDIFENTKIIFEQSSRNLKKYFFPNNKVIYTPLAFQGNIKNKKAKNTSYDIVFNGTLDRSRRLTSKTHRQDIMLGLLKKGYSVINYNGRSDKEVEKKLLKPLRKFNNFKIVNKFGNAKHYNHGKFSLHIPFHELGSEEGIYYDWGMSRKELEDTNWLNNWDIYRCIGAKSNIITFDCPELRDLGLSESNCSFYKNDPSNVEGIISEVSKIIDKNIIKNIDEDTWLGNTYMKRWQFIIDQIIHERSA